MKGIDVKTIATILALMLAAPAMAEDIVICAGASTMNGKWLPTWNARGERNRESPVYDERTGNGYAGLCDRKMLPRQISATVINVARAGANAEQIRRSDPQPLLPDGHTAQSQGYDAVLLVLRKLARQGRLRQGRDRAVVLLGITNDPNPLAAANKAVTMIERARARYGARVQFLVEKPPTFSQVDFARQRDFTRNRATLGDYWGLAISKAPVPPPRLFDLVGQMYMANLRGQPGVSGEFSLYVWAKPDRDTLDGVHLTPQRMNWRAKAVAKRITATLAR